ncbi:YjfI family protein [Kiloniella sp. EL199]|uniref:YjfI family protein n=1 Tax=Kiloniella sp. EL199 TaxID=2107581 RepID=UPI0013C4F594|nr:YjfI family protein [Kiloniella sp. EL199]
MSTVLKDCENALREGLMPEIPTAKGKKIMNQEDVWTTESLFDAISASDNATNKELLIELVEGADPGILITMNEFGDLPIFMSVSGSQIVAESLLWPVKDVDDAEAFNAMLLRSHKLMPLSTFGIAPGPDGQDYYEIFGALSAGSKLESILEEIETLADNAIQAVEAFDTAFRKSA